MFSCNINVLRAKVLIKFIIISNVIIYKFIWPIDGILKSITASLIFINAYAHLYITSTYTTLHYGKV